MKTWCSCDKKKVENKDERLSSAKLELVSEFYKQ